MEPPAMGEFEPRLGLSIRSRGLSRGLGCSGIVVGCSKIVVIPVFRGNAPKARRETFVTTETYFGKPSRVPEGCLKLVPRLWWSLGACGPILGGAFCLSVGRAPGALSEKASMRDRGVPALVACPENASGHVIGQFGTERDFWSPILGTFRCSGDSVMNSATVPAPSFLGFLVRPAPGFDRESSRGKPVGQNGVLIACPSLVACSFRGCSQRSREATFLVPATASVVVLYDSLLPRVGRSGGCAKVSEPVVGPKPVESGKVTRPKPMESSKITRPKPVESGKVTRPKPMESSKITRPKPVESGTVTRPKPVESNKVDAKSVDTKSGKQ
ncbi:hypothetical protein CRG98_036620 [Punica granatum]|uniref:Uncharacterized protein n=1 Tax=Punica granatum TaxID=22663 RepID=A0A2I0IG62_PUNGR|nr:hypothetical protein CRG98_036620 [Punica granatum]